MGPEALQALVRRAVARALERDDSARATGVHVEVTPPAEKPARRKGPPLVTVDCLAKTPDGGAFAVPAGANVTPLAHEEAWRRGIRLETRHHRHDAPTPEGDGPWTVAVGCDHGGFASKELVLAAVREAGHRPVDLGTWDETAVDYPDVAAEVARGVADGRFAVGIVIDGAGIGSAMAANKVPGVRAANCWNEQSATNAREHNYANVLTLGGRMLDAGTLDRVVRTFLRTPWGAARHGRRVDKITALEQRPSPTPR